MDTGDDAANPTTGALPLETARTDLTMRVQAQGSRNLGIRDTVGRQPDRQGEITPAPAVIGTRPDLRSGSPGGSEDSV